MVHFHALTIEDFEFFSESVESAIGCCAFVPNAVKRWHKGNDHYHCRAVVQLLARSLEKCIWPSDASGFIDASRPVGEVFEDGEEYYLTAHHAAITIASNCLELAWLCSGDPSAIENPNFASQASAIAFLKSTAFYNDNFSPPPDLGEKQIEILFRKPRDVNRVKALVQGERARAVIAMKQAGVPLHAVPRWTGRQLTFRGQMIAEPATQAKNIRAMLDAFEAASWATEIENPLGEEQTRQLLKNLDLLPLDFTQRDSHSRLCWSISLNSPPPP